MSVDRKDRGDTGLRDWCIHNLNLAAHRPEVYALALAGLSLAVAFRWPNSSPAKIAIPTVEPTSTAIYPTATLDYPLDRWVEWTRWMRGAVLRYKFLQGPTTETNPDPFYQSRDAFLAAVGSGDRIPFSMAFVDQDGRAMQVAKDSDIFTKDAISIFFLEGRLTGSDLCAQPSEIRTEAYRRLAEGFVWDQYADRSLIEKLVGGATPDCDYFYGPGKIPRPTPTFSGTPRM